MNLNYRYDIELKIGEHNYSENVFKVEQLCSIYYVMDLFLISFMEDMSDILDEKIFGTENVNLKIRYTRLDKSISEETVIDLLVLKMNFPVLSRENNVPGGKSSSYQPRKITLVCVPKIPFEKLYTNVNFLTRINNNKRPIDIVKTLVNLYLKKDILVDINERNSNNNTVFQCLISPMYFVESIKYIDNKYSIYQGTKPFFYISSYEPTIQLWDMKKKLEDDYAFKINLLNLGKDKVGESPGKDNNVYITNHIKTIYSANEKTVSSGYVTNYISKPLDTLYKIDTVNVSDVFRSNSLTETNSEMTVNEVLKNLIKWDHTIEDNKFLNQNIISTKINSSSEIQLMLDTDIPWISLTKVGQRVLLNSNKESYKAYSGNYINKKAFIKWERYTKSNYYQCSAIINMIRGFY